MVWHVTPSRLGHYVGQARAVIGHLDHGMRVSRTVYDAVKRSVPEGKIKRAAERGLSDYEAVREKIRAANP